MASFISCPDLDIAEARWAGSVARTHHLLRLAFAAVRSAPERPLVTRANRIHRIPEFSCDAGVRRIFQHSAALTIFDLPPDFATELEVVPLVINRP